MRQLVETISGFRLGLLVLWLAMASASAQNSNRVWFALYNGAPTPSADVAVQTFRTDGSATAIPTGAIASYIAQTNLTALNSPYDVAVDAAMGKVYVLDNNVTGATNEYLYAFNLSGTPAQIAASKQIIYTMPVPAADAAAKIYPLLAGIAVDISRHVLYFNQIDITTGTNSYLGRIDLTSSIASNIHSVNGGNPTLQTFHAGQMPGVGPITLDSTNVYIGAINAGPGNSGIYTAPRDSNVPFTQLVGLSVNNVQFTNGFASGVAGDPADHLIYYLTFNAGVLNHNFDLRQNALWIYDTVAHTSQKIGSGYGGYPDNLTIDPANRRYYFTVGRDGSGNANPTNYQAIYTGSLGATNSPTLLFQPMLTGQDIAGQPNAGGVALQGICVEDPPQFGAIPAAANYPVLGAPVTLATTLTMSDFSSTTLSNAQVKISSGWAVGDTLTATTNGTAISVSYDPQAAILSLTGYDSLTNYQQVLRSVSFSSTNANPTLNNTDNQRTISWSANDGAMISTPTTTTLNILTGSTNLLNRITITSVVNGWNLRFVGIANQKYVVQKAAAVNGSWTDLSGVLTADGNGIVVYVDQSTSLAVTRFYRVRTGP